MCMWWSMCLCLWVFYKYGKWRRESGLALRLLLLLARRENILAKRYIYFFKPPSTAPPAVLYFSFFSFFLCVPYLRCCWDWPCAPAYWALSYLSGVVPNLWFNSGVCNRKRKTMFDLLKRTLRANTYTLMKVSAGFCLQLCQTKYARKCQLSFCAVTPSAAKRY